MKELRETKWVEQTTVKFIANDGKEFEDEGNCLHHERMINIESLKNNFERLYPIEIRNPLALWCDDEREFYKITLRSKRELNDVLDYFEAICGEYFERSSKFEDLNFATPQTIILIKRCECLVFCYFDDLVKEINSFTKEYLNV